MAKRFWRLVVAGGAGVLAMGVAAAATQLPAIGAGGLLHPFRRPVTRPAPDGCANVTLQGDGLALAGWRCPAEQSRRGAVVYLHGIADNRSSSVGIIERFRPRGFDVIAYDSRANGNSGGDVCTYGFYEKRDLKHVIDTLTPGPVVLIGTSLGAAVALQEAAGDERISAIVAAETFSDLRTVATERAPFFFTPPTIARAFRLAERDGHFTVDDVSPEEAARHTTAPTLLVHGTDDIDTRPDHSRRVYDALRGPKRLILVPGAHHGGALRADVWTEIEAWIDEALRSGARLP